MAMVATRALFEPLQDGDTETELRRCIRDLVSLSSLPAIWIKADAIQIADSLGQLAVSILDAEFACVLLRDPELEVIHCHDRSIARPIDLRQVRERYRPNSKFEIDDGHYGQLHAMCVPIGREGGSGLITLSRRSGFPTNTEQTLLRVAANLAGIALQRWKSEAQRAEQTRLLERQNETEKALYTFTDRLFRAKSRNDIYEAGLDAILGVLRCDHASILLFDDCGVMRFVAWRYLSEEYRSSVDGHSPWKPDDHAANPIYIDYIGTTDALSEELKAVVIAEGIAALAFIPIFAGGKIVGKFMAYYDAPHTFEPKEIDAGITIARQFGFGLERLRAEETTQRLATIVETSDDAIISKNLDGIILTWNRGAQRIFGYTAEEVVGNAVTILMPPERYDEEPGILARLRRGERIDHYETVRRRKDGTLIDVSLTVSPVRDKAGHIIGASKIARDISDQKRAEVGLRELATLVEASRDAIWSWAIDGTITSWNAEAERMLGYKAAEIVGKSILTLIPPDRITAAHDIISKVRQGQSYAPWETIRLGKNGKPLPVELTVSPIRSFEGRVTGAATVCRDISARKQAEVRIASDLRDMTRLNELNNRLVREGTETDENLTAIVETAIALAGADKGNLQLFNSETGMLTIAAQRGFGAPFLKFFERVRDDAFACSTAMRFTERVIVEDVASSEIFAGQPSLDVLMKAGVRAVISTPLMSSTGELLGIFSTHFGKPHRPDERELRLLDLLARQAADYLERKRAEEIQHTLTHEIQHRSNNLLAVIQTIARRTLSGDCSLADAKAGFEARLQALARANQQLTASDWSGVSLTEIVHSELQPFGGRIVIDGVNVLLDPKHAQNFSLALHELATNAAKYGALSNGNGQVGVSWALTTQRKTNTLRFQWRESGGPPVARPTRYGFGTALLRTTFPDARIDYATEGLSCEIDIKLGTD